MDIKGGTMDINISILITSIYFQLDRVFILNCREKYRLIVYHRGRMLTDVFYKSAKGARIAFLKEYGYKLDDATRLVLESQKQQPVRWTHFYPLDSTKWLERFQGLLIDNENGANDETYF
ncbi:MAG: hypothetical protein GY765_03545 [bacterium]|nr:hypothetical protein [bacterium]